MPTLVGYGDKLLSATGRRVGLKRPSVPFAQFGQRTIALAGDGRVVSYGQLYEQQPWIGVVVNKIYRQIARLPLTVHRWVGDDGESEPVRRHALVDLLRHPWPRASELRLKEKAAFPTLVHGNALLWKRRPAPGAPPDQLVPLHWLYVSPIIIDGQHVGWATTEFGEVIRIPLEDVVHFAWEAGNCYGFGLSPLAQLGVTLRSEDSAQRYQASSFENGARPSGALVLPPDQRLDEDEKEELRQQIRQQQAGDNAFNVALLSGGMTWEAFSHTAVEAELIEQRKLNREEIAAAYDIDPPMIGILDHATYSNVGEMHKMLYGPTLGPWLELLTATINSQLIEPVQAWADERLFVAFDLSEVLKSNTREEIAAIKDAVGTGVMTPNEGRAKMRLPRSANGAADELYIPANNLQPLGADATLVSPRELAEQLQKIYLAVGKVITADEARAILDRGGANLGTAPPDLTTGAEPDPGEPVVADDDEVAKSHVARHRRLIITGRKFDRERFVRELGADLPDLDPEPLVKRLEAYAAAHAALGV